VGQSTINRQGATLRRSPEKTKTNILATLNAGQTVQVFHRVKGWQFVEAMVKGKAVKGYVSHELVDVAPVQVDQVTPRDKGRGDEVTPAKNRGDEVTPIARYMADEMQRNANSEVAKSISANKKASVENCVKQYKEMYWFQQMLVGQEFLNNCTQGVMAQHAAAWMSWTWKVMDGGDWDHKPLIRKKFTPAVPSGSTQEWHHYGGYLYYYDIWSNIHYGFVGKACGFTASELLDGAGLEQIGSDLLRGNWPSSSPGVKGLRRFDDASDRAAISIGMELYALPSWPTAAALIQCITSAKDLTRKKL